MKILLDCRFQKGAGPNVTARYMIDHLIKINKRHDFLILKHENQLLPDYPEVEQVVVPYRNPFLEFLWVQLCLPSLMHRNSVDLCHSLKHIGPLYTRVPTILHLREVMHFLPQGKEVFELNLPNKIYWHHVLVWGLKKATHIIGVSDECRKVINEQLGIPQEKVSTVYQGLDAKFKVIRDSEISTEKRHRYNLPDNYILCVGNFYPHKNYDTVVKMFKKLRDHNESEMKLVMVGDENYASSSFFDLIKQLGLQNEITFTKYVEHDDLVYIYNAASLFLFPPLVASFPNPCLEAMACGVPVVASDLGAIAEVTGGAALLLKNPRDENEMFNTVCEVIANDLLREELRIKGFKRAKDFSWQASAAKVLDIYENVGNSYLF